MSDKTRRLYEIAIKFTEGEQPTAAKLTGLSTQAKNAFSIVEQMLGDIWNQAGDPILSPGSNPTGNALHIANIARGMGKLGRLNSMIPGTFNSAMLYIDDIGTRHFGKNRGYLKYKPNATPSLSSIILSGTFAPLVQLQFKSNPADVQSVGDWSVDTDGLLYTFDAIPSTLTVQYVPIVITDIADLNGNTASWNLIPDPTTWSGSYAGVKISFANNTDSSTGYHIWLPPRKPLDSTKTLKTSPTGTSNVSATPNSGSLLAFQNITNDASITFADHYRYNFPIEITNVGGANDALPTGFLYVWDQTTGTIVDGLSFFVPGATGDRKFKVRVTGTNAIAVFGTTIGNGIVTDDTTQLPADYISRFKIITVGASIAKTLSYLSKSFWNHAHKNTEGNSPISHRDLTDLVTPGHDATYNTIYPSGVHSFAKSAWLQDDHPQYLHRGGSTLVSGVQRDAHDNALFNRLTIKSPYTTPRTGLMLSADDSGTNVRISASAGIALLLDGATNAAINLINTQVSRFLYFRPNDTSGPDNSSSTLALGNYIQLASGTYQFVFNSAFANLNAGNIIGVTSVTGGSSVNSPTFNYTTTRQQHLTVQSNEAIVPAAFQVDLLYAVHFLYNSSTSNVYSIFIPVNFPDGAILTASSVIRMWTAGNGSAGLTMNLIAAAKPTGTFVSLSTTTIASSSFNTSTSSIEEQFTYGVTHVVDNSLTGNIYYMSLSFPVAISGNQPKFYFATFQYIMPSVNN